MKKQSNRYWIDFPSHHVREWRRKVNREAEKWCRRAKTYVDRARIRDFATAARLAAAEGKNLEALYYFDAIRPSKSRVKAEKEWLAARAKRKMKKRS